MKIVRLLIGITCGLLISGNVWSAKVILKDGKIIEGKIIAETDGDVLIRTSAMRRSKFIRSDQILSVVRDPAEVKVRDPQRYAEMEMGLSGNAFSSSEMSLDPAVGLRLGGGLRFHPLIQVGGDFEWQPAMSGELSVSDGVTTRNYTRFLSYGGGFSAHLFPLYKVVHWKVEPFLIVGYQWYRLAPKGTEDDLNGGGLNGGLGAAWPLSKSLFLKTTFLYHNIVYDRIFFLLRSGDLDPGVATHTYSLITSLAWRL